MYTRDYVLDTSGSYGGALISVPDKVVVGSDIQVSMVFSPPERGLKQGAIIRFQVPIDWLPPQIRSPDEAGYLSVECPVKHELYKKKITDKLEYWRIVYLKLLEELSAGCTIRIRYNYHEDGSFRPVVSQIARYDPVDFALDVKEPGDEKYRRIAIKKVYTMGGAPDHIMIRVPTIAIGNEPFDIYVIIKDEFGNISPNYSGIVRLEAADALEIPEKITFRKSDHGSKCVKDACRFVGDVIPESSEERLLMEPKGYYGFFGIPPPREMENVQRIYAFDPNLGIRGASNPVVHVEEKSKDRIYWGDLHVHTRDFSDGCGTARDAYWYMKEVSKLDFGGLADHSFQGGFPTTEENPKNDMHIAEDEWSRIIEIARDESVPGKFVGVPGYEWSGRVEWATKGWPYPAVSDKTVHFPNYKKSNPLVYSNKDDGNTPQKLYAALRGIDALIITHSPAHTPMGTAWEEVNNEMEPVVEIYSMHGSNEFYGCPRQIISPFKDHFVSDALKKGFKLGFVGGGDDHYTHPGCTVEQRKIKIPPLPGSLKYTPGVTAVMCDELELSKLIQAIKLRRCYATTGPLIWIDLRVNGARMGEEIRLEGPPLIVLSAAGTDVIDRVDIIRDGEIIYSRTTSYEKIKFAYRDTGYSKDARYYYARLTQADGHMAWTSPIYIKKERE